MLAVGAYVYSTIRLIFDASLSLGEYISSSISDFSMVYSDTDIECLTIELSAAVANFDTSIFLVSWLLVVVFESLEEAEGFITRTFSRGMSSSRGIKPDFRSNLEIRFSSYRWGVPRCPQFISTKCPSGLRFLSYSENRSPSSCSFRSCCMAISVSNMVLENTKNRLDWGLSFFCALSKARIANSNKCIINLSSLITRSRWVSSSILKLHTSS